MKASYDFVMWADVHDPAQLYRAAVQRCRDENEGQSPEDVLVDLGTENDPDIEACLVMLPDPGSLPGCSITESGATAAVDVP